MTKPPTQIERFHIERLVAMGCLICQRPAIYHHSLLFRPRNHQYGVPLCPDHHNMTNDSVHMMGDEEEFFKKHGIADVKKWVMTQWFISQSEVLSC